MFSEQDLKNKLTEFISLPSETEWLEFKEANDNFSTHEIGKYFSALSNEANLLNKDFAWLIFGVNKVQNVVGTDYRMDKPRLNSLKQQIAEGTTNRLSFVEIHEIYYSEKRVIMFQIPPAPLGIPISWKGHYYGREHESLGALGLKYEKIRGQKKFDWSAQLIENATINDLDEKAIKYAKQKFKEGNERRDFYDEIDSWDTITFLNKARLTVEGKITTTALLLLGNAEAKRFLFPNARITYVYINEHGEKQDYEHFDPPFLLERDNLLNRLKHKDSKLKILPDENTLTPIEIYRYDNWIILEALNNCIAHQDYTKQDKIIVTEKANHQLIFRSSGTFYYGTIEDYIFFDDFTPPDYRNPFLAEAMERIGMIDTVGSGIKKIFNRLREKFLPLPEYLLGDFVELTIIADNKSNNYTSQLYNNPNLNLGEVFLIDKNQKNFPIDDKDYQYIIISHLKQQRRAGREDIEKLLIPYLDNALSIRQKKKKVNNLLYALSKNKKIINISSSTKKPIWILS